MLVVVLIGILVALAAPNLTGYIRQTKVDRALDELTGDVAYARMLAVRSGRSAHLTIESTGTAYVIGVDGSAQDAKRVDLSRDFQGVSLAPASTVLRFDSRGLRLPGANETTITAQQGSSSASLSVLPTGRAYRAF